MADCSNSGQFLPANQAKNLARNWQLIWEEICAIQKHILAATSQCTETGGQFCTIIKGDTPMTFISEILSVTVTDGGAGYDSPSIVFTDSTGRNAEAVAAVIDTTITEVSVTKGGSSYTDSVVVTAVETTPEQVPTVDAVLTASVTPNPNGYDSYPYYLYVVKQSDNRSIQDQLDYVQSYFTNLGYWIEPQVNPDTLATIQWYVCW